MPSHFYSAFPRCSEFSYLSCLIFFQNWLFLVFQSLSVIPDKFSIGERSRQVHPNAVLFSRSSRSSVQANAVVCLLRMSKFLSELSELLQNWSKAEAVLIDTQFLKKMMHAPYLSKFKKRKKPIFPQLYQINTLNNKLKKVTSNFQATLSFSDAIFIDSVRNSFNKVGI